MRNFGESDHFVAGAIGEPGRRTFLIEIGGDDAIEWFVLEKQQVAALAQRSLELLRQRGLHPDEPGPDLSSPGESTFRIGEIAVGEDGENIVIVLSPTDDEPTDPVAVTVSPQRLGAMAVRALHVVGAGRPACRFCGLPMDSDAHTCPAFNGDLRDR